MSLCHYHPRFPMTMLMTIFWNSTFGRKKVACSTMYLSTCWTPSRRSRHPALRNCRYDSHLWIKIGLKILFLNGTYSNSWNAFPLVSTSSVGQRGQCWRVVWAIDGHTRGEETRNVHTTGFFLLLNSSHCSQHCIKRILWKGNLSSTKIPFSFLKGPNIISSFVFRVVYTCDRIKIESQHL